MDLTIEVSPFTFPIIVLSVVLILQSVQVALFVSMWHGKRQGKAATRSNDLPRKVSVEMKTLDIDDDKVAASKELVGDEPTMACGMAYPEHAKSWKKPKAKAQSWGTLLGTGVVSDMTKEHEAANEACAARLSSCGSVDAMHAALDMKQAAEVGQSNTKDTEGARQIETCAMDTARAAEDVSLFGEDGFRGRLDAEVVFSQLPKSMQLAFELSDIAALQSALEAMPSEDVKRYMKMCVKSGLWNPDAGNCYYDEDPDDDKNGDDDKGLDDDTDDGDDDNDEAATEARLMRDRGQCKSRFKKSHVYRLQNFIFKTMNLAYPLVAKQTIRFTHCVSGENGSFMQSGPTIERLRVVGNSTVIEYEKTRP